MVGRAAEYDFTERARDYGEVRLAVEGVNVVGAEDGGRVSVNDVSLRCGPARSSACTG